MTDIKIGDKVIDHWKHKGIVVEITKGHDIKDHGVIAVWQSDRINYGDDNCDHYPYFGWENILKIL